MRVGIVVDGFSEVDALPHLLARIQTRYEIRPRVIKSRFHPTADTTLIAGAAAKSCQVFAPLRLNLIVLLLDLEDRTGCPGAFAQTLRQHFETRVVRMGLNVRVDVVVKVSKFENWLVADLACLSGAPRLFPDASRVADAVPRGNADGVDALAILKRASGPRRSYQKVKSAEAICRHLDPGRAALNSRSFRRFLRVLGDRRYTDQSRLPIHQI